MRTSSLDLELVKEVLNVMKAVIKEGHTKIENLFSCINCSG